MVMSIAQYGVSVLYRCYKLPRYNCKHHSEDNHECLSCKYCKAEMSGADAHKLLSGYRKGKHGEL